MEAQSVPVMKVAVPVEQRRLRASGITPEADGGLSFQMDHISETPGLKLTENGLHSETMDI